jgi:hypothetical protein
MRPMVYKTINRDACQIAGTPNNVRCVKRKTFTRREIRTSLQSQKTVESTFELTLESTVESTVESTIESTVESRVEALWPSPKPKKC